MELKVYDDYAALSEAAAQLVLDQVNQKPTSVICLASGDTPKLTCQRIVAMARAEKIDFSKITFIGLDEWVGIEPNNEGSCYWFFQNHFIKPLNLSSDRVRLFDVQSDLSSECQKTDALIEQKGGIDLMLVGVGINGHIGLNEPGISEKLKCHVADLHATTIAVGQKYFKQGAVLKQGITVGLHHFMESKMAVVMANGSKKAAIMKAALANNISMDVPATIIQKHNNGIVLLDKEAASLLNG